MKYPIRSGSVAFTGKSEQVIMQVQVQPPTLQPTSSVIPTGSTTTTTTASTTITTTYDYTTPTYYYYYYYYYYNDNYDDTPNNNDSHVDTDHLNKNSCRKLIATGTTAMPICHHSLRSQTPRQSVSPPGSSSAFSFVPKSNKYVETIKPDGVTVYVEHSVGTTISYTIPNHCRKSYSDSNIQVKTPIFKVRSDIQIFLFADPNVLEPSVQIRYAYQVFNRGRAMTMQDRTKNSEF